MLLTGVMFSTASLNPVKSASPQIQTIHETQRPFNTGLADFTRSSPTAQQALNVASLLFNVHINGNAVVCNSEDDESGIDLAVFLAGIESKDYCLIGDFYSFIQ